MFTSEETAYCPLWFSLLNLAPLLQAVLNRVWEDKVCRCWWLRVGPLRCDFRPDCSSGGSTLGDSNQGGFAVTFEG